MEDESVNLILRELDISRQENRESHKAIDEKVAHTNGIVAELVAWKIQVKTVLWIFGLVLTLVVIPISVNVISNLLKKKTTLINSITPYDTQNIQTNNYQYTE